MSRRPYTGPELPRWTVETWGRGGYGLHEVTAPSAGEALALAASQLLGTGVQPSRHRRVELALLHRSHPAYAATQAAAARLLSETAP